MLVGILAGQKILQNTETSEPDPGTHCIAANWQFAPITIKPGRLACPPFLTLKTHIQIYSNKSRGSLICSTKIVAGCCGSGMLRVWYKTYWKYVFRLGPLPFVILYGAEECEAILSSNKVYRNLQYCLQ